MVTDFYDRLSPFYHLIFQDWEESIEWQGKVFDELIRNEWGDVTTILDVACGIGTQSLGLAGKGYRVTGSDLSASAIHRAKREARERKLSIDFSVADMREAFSHHRSTFDILLACDNAIPHLLSDAEILRACEQFYQCLRPDGGCIITLRDYDRFERSGTRVEPYGMKIIDGVKHIIFQVWEFKGMVYDLAMYFISDDGSTRGETRIFRTQYYSVSVDRVVSLMESVGFRDVQRNDDVFYQPVITARK